MGVAGEVGDPAVAALVLGPDTPASPSWWEGDLRRRSYGEWWAAAMAPTPPLGPAPREEEEEADGPPEEPPAGAAAVGAGMFCMRWQTGSHGSDVVLEGVGILFAPFLLDLLTYDLEAVKEALGIFTTTNLPQKKY